MTKGDSFRRVRRQGLALCVGVPLSVGLIWIAGRGSEGLQSQRDLAGLLGAVGVTAVWCVGLLWPLVVKPAAAPVWQGSVALLRVAPSRRLSMALMSWPLLPLSWVVPGDAWKLAIPLSLGTMALFWALTGQRVLLDDVRVRMEGGLGGGGELAWSDVSKVSVKFVRVMVRAQNGPWIGINAMAMDGASEFLVRLLEKVPGLTEEQREQLEGMRDWAAGGP